VELFSVFGRIALDDSEFQQGIGQAEEQGRGLASTMAGVAKGVAVASAAIGAAVAGIGVAAMNVGSDWQASMNTIGVRTGMADEEIRKLEMSFRDSALAGNFAAQEIAQASGKIAVTGQDATHHITLMDSAMNFALATGKYLGSTAYMLGNYLLKVGKDAIYAERYTNLFTQGIFNSGIGLADMQNYLFRMTPAFQEFGASSEANIAIMTRMYQAGIRGANLYTGMGTIMMDFATAGDISTAAVERFNISLTDSNGNARDNKDIMFDLADAMHSYNDTVAVAQFITEEMNLTQQAAWFEFMRLSEEIRNEVIPGLYDAASASEIAGEQVVGFHQAMGMARASGKDMLLTIHEIIEAPVASVVQTIAESLRDLALRLRDNNDLRPYIERLGTAISTIAQSVGNLITTATPFVVRLLPMLATGLTTVLRVAEPLTPVILAGVVAFKAYKAAMTIGNIAHQTINGIKLLTGAKKLQTTATIANTAAVVAAEKAEYAKIAAMKIRKNVDALATAAQRARTKAEKAQAAVSKGGIINEKLRAEAVQLSAQADMLAAKHQNARKALSIAQNKANGLETASTIKKTAATKAQTIAQKAQNVAMKANPIGLKIAAVAALTTGIIQLVRWMGRESEETQKLRRQNEALNEALDRRISATERSTDSHNNRVRAIDNDAIAARRLISSITELNDVENQSVYQRAELMLHTSRLVSLMPELNAYIDEETGLLNLSNDALLQRITLIEEEARVAAARERAVTLAREQIELEELLTEALELRGQAHERVYEIGIHATRAEINEQRYLGRVVRDLDETIADLTERQYANARAQERNADIVRDSYIQMIQSSDEYANAVEYNAIATAAALRELTESQSQALNQIISTYESVKTAARQMFRAMSNDTEMSLDEIEANLKNNIDVTEQWGIDIGRLGRMAGEGLYDGFIEYLQSLGINGADKVRMFAQALDDDPDGLKRISDLFEQGGASAMNAIVNAFGHDEYLIRQMRELAQTAGTTLHLELEEAGFYGMGADVVYSFVNAINARQSLAREATAALACQAELGMANQLERVNPLMVFWRYGEDTATSYADGVARNAQKAVMAVQKMAQGAANVADEINIDIPLLSTGDAHDDFDFGSILAEKVNVFRARFAEIVEIVTNKFVEMSQMSNNILRRMTRDIDQLLSREGFNIGRNFFRALGDGMIAEQATLFGLARHTVDTIMRMFSDPSFTFDMPNNPFAQFDLEPFSAQASNGIGGNAIIQHFHGVKEKETGYQALRAFQKAELMGVV